MIKELLEQITKEICEYQEDISVIEFPANISTTIEIHVNSNDYGKMIGKGGKVIQAIRTIIYTISFKYKKRYNIEIISKDKQKNYNIKHKDSSVEINSNHKYPQQTEFSNINNQ